MSISLQSKCPSRWELPVSWGDGLYLEGIDGRAAITIIWAKGDLPKDDAMLECGMAPCVDERARSILR